MPRIAMTSFFELLKKPVCPILLMVISGHTNSQDIGEVTLNTVKRLVGWRVMFMVVPLIGESHSVSKCNLEEIKFKFRTHREIL